MQHVRQRPASATSPSPATTTEVAAATHAAATTSNGKKKSILKKSESGSHHGHHHHHPTLLNAAKAAVTGTGNATAGDPELENLLVASDPDTSANTTPASVRKPTLSMGNLPPTANHDQLKSLTGPKLRVGVKEQQPQQQQQQQQPLPPRKPILVNNVQNNNKNNGNVASKEIQTSTANLLALAATAGMTLVISLVYLEY